MHTHGSEDPTSRCRLIGPTPISLEPVNKEREQNVANQGKNGVSARITPAAGLEVLSQNEVARLSRASQGDLYETFRSCSLAVLRSGSSLDDADRLLALHRDFSIKVLTMDRGVQLQLTAAPDEAFVDGQLIEGVRTHLFSVLRDLVYTNTEIYTARDLDLDVSSDVTHAVFYILRNAGLLRAGREPRIVVFWGGHSIDRTEYEYSKKVGYELGLRGQDICTGCGPGAMKGPMKGAAVAHRKQRIHDGRYIGVTEPGIIAAESPNPIVGELVILPDIEKRLEAFVRLGHGLIVLPGGVGTAEEIFFLIGILLDPANRDIPFPVILTGPEGSEEYFERILQFLDDTIGSEAVDRLRLMPGDPAAVAQAMTEGIADLRAFRRKHHDAFHFNWNLTVDPLFQRPFQPTHENMASLRLDRSQPAHELAANLRRAFSGIVAGNVKAEGVRSIREHGRFKIQGDRDLLARLDELLSSFVAQNRMKIEGGAYDPCYEILGD